MRKIDALIKSVVYIKVVIAKIILLFCVIPAFSQYSIVVDTVRVDSSKIAYVNVHITNQSEMDYSIHEDELLSGHILFSDNEIMEPVARILFMKDPPKTEKERLHFVKKGTSITLRLKISLE